MTTAAARSRSLFNPLLACMLLLPLAACGGRGGGGGGGSTDGPPPALSESREFRAIAGVSMGGYGALNLGTKHADLFGTIASLGGPVDLMQLLRDSLDDNLEVKPQTGLPRALGADFTFDHLAPYPDRDSRISMTQDLSIAFGNPFLHHPDPARRYLASDSEPARLLVDDAFGPFMLPADPRGFSDGGDANDNGVRETSEVPTVPTDVMLLAGGTLERIAGAGPATLVGGRALRDLDADGIYDVGDGLVVNLSEPFVDPNGNRAFEPSLGETYDDLGLDGVPGTGDFGEGNGQFDEDPDVATWRAEDPLTRLTSTPAATVGQQRLYMDVGTEDEFGFALHYDNLVAVLRAKGFSVEIDEGFAGNCANLPDPTEPFLLTRYNGGHVGFESVDADELLNGDVCGNDTIWQRIVTMIGYLNQSFPDGVFGPGSGGGNFDLDFDPPDLDDLDPGDIDFDVDLPDLDPSGNIISADIDAPALAGPDGTVPSLPVVIYRPPAFFRSDESFPIVYFLGGYGQEPEDFARIDLLLDALILTGQLQNMYFAFLPGQGGRTGSFYVNHAISDSQIPEIGTVTSGRHEDAIFQDLIPAIEHTILRRRVRTGPAA